MRKRRVRVCYRATQYGEVSPGAVVPRLDIEQYGTELVAPYGTDLALLSGASGQLHSGLWIDVEIRDGRPKCVAIRSDDGGPEITSELLRFPLGNAVAEIVRHHTVRLGRDETGKEFAVFLSSPEYPADRRTIEERTRAIDESVPKRGRRPLTDDFLRAVADVYRDARAAGRPTDRAIVDRLDAHATLATARGWARKAHLRGFLPELKPRTRPAP